MEATTCRAEMEYHWTIRLEGRSAQSIRPAEEQRPPERETNCPILEALLTLGIQDRGQSTQLFFGGS